MSRLNAFTNLKELILSGNNEISGNTIISLISAAPFTRELHTLKLSNTGITGIGTMLISKPGIFTTLKKLDLSVNASIDDAAAAKLLTAPFAGKLELLNLERTGITERTIQLLAQSGISQKILA